MCRNPILCAVSPVSQNLYGQSLNDFHIFLAMKYASFGHSGYCRNHYGRLSHLREKYGKSPPKILSIFTSRQHNFSPNAFFRFHITQHNGNYRMIPFHWYVLCIGILLCWHANDVMFLGYQAHFGTQKNYATGTSSGIEQKILAGFNEGNMIPYCKYLQLYAISVNLPYY